MAATELEVQASLVSLRIDSVYFALVVNRRAGAALVGCSIVVTGVCFLYVNTVVVEATLRVSHQRFPLQHCGRAGHHSKDETYVRDPLW